MAKHILLLRGVNVGGVKLAMADLRAALADAGAQRVQTYIQSGNAVFDGPVSQTAIADCLKARTGLSPDLFIYDGVRFGELAAAGPYPAPEGARVHLFFLSQPSDVDQQVLRDLARNESFTLTDEVLYLSAPDGIGRSVLVDQLPRLLGVAMTARNWNTVRALIGMAQAAGPG
jgi:uncharacterized protein (DUF1697 family)